MLCNDVSRYHVAAMAVRQGGLHNAKVQPIAHELATLFMHMAQKDKEYIYRHGEGESSRRDGLVALPYESNTDGKSRSQGHLRYSDVRRTSRLISSESRERAAVRKEPFVELEQRTDRFCVCIYDYCKSSTSKEIQTVFCDERDACTL